MDFHKISEGILGEETTEKTNTEIFLSLVGQYFPEAIKDGEVDFTALKEEMGEFPQVSSEHYDFTWAGKQAAKKEAMSDIYGRTLKYKPQDSLNPDTTENIYIEGDNLEALKLLRRSYHGKIKMIYIDPPYNTGNDFIYHDDFFMTEEELAEKSGDVVDGVRYQKNGKDGSRYHTNWLNMMYPRLKIARDLLSDDGAIFISIDDNEQENLKKLCDEILGSKNFVAQLVWEKKKKGAFLSKNYINMKEYVLVYAKHNPSFGGLIGEINSASETYPCIKTTNARGIRIIKKGTPSKCKEKTYTIKSGTRISAGNMELIYLNDLIVENGILQNDVEIDSNWIYSQQALDEYSDEGLLYITQDNYIRRIVNDDRIKMLKDLLTRVGIDGTSLPYYKYDLNMNNGGWGTNEDANDELHELMKHQYLFDFSKPTRLIAKLIQTITKEKDTILDFFSGSATTAHAVMQLNAEDGGNRKYIMVQYPEVCGENTEAAKAGYKNVCEIGKERIRRAAKKIHNDNPNAKFDDGFKVFEVADTNIKWNTVNDEDITSLNEMDYGTDKDRIDFTKGYTDIDVVYEIMLRQYNIPLSTPVEKLPQVSDRTYIFADAVVVCLEPEISTELIEKLAAVEPTPAKFVLRDSAFNDDIELKDVSFRRLSSLIRTHQTEEERKSKYNNYVVEFI